MSKSRTLFFALFCIFPSVQGQCVPLSGKRPNILENLAQTVAGEPIELYNSPIRKTLVIIVEYSFQAAKHAK